VEASADVVFGSYEPVCDTFFRRCAAVAYVPARGPHGIRGPFVASMALARDAFERAGRFPPFRAAEDLIFMERLCALPLRIAYAPRAVVRWQLAPDVARTFRRFASYSEHNLRAGRGRYWHRGVLRHYVLIAFLTAAAFLAGAAPGPSASTRSGSSRAPDAAPGKSAARSTSTRSTRATSSARPRCCP
jgi:hypothetical protein